MEVYKYVKGGIWWCDFSNDQPRGLIQGRHMAIIISEVSNPSSNCTLTVLPISSMNSSKDSEEKLKLFHCVPITIYKSCFVCCNQPTTIVTSQLHGYIGQVNGKKLQLIEEELMRYFQFYIEPGYDVSPKLSVDNPTIENEDNMTDNSACLIETQLEDNIEDDKSISVIKKTKRPRKKVRVIETGEIFPSVRSCYMHFHVSRYDVENAAKKGGTIYSTLGYFHLKYEDL